MYATSVKKLETDQTSVQTLSDSKSTNPESYSRWYCSDGIWGTMNKT